MVHLRYLLGDRASRRPGRVRGERVPDFRDADPGHSGATVPDSHRVPHAATSSGRSYRLRPEGHERTWQSDPRHDRPLHASSDAPPGFDPSRATDRAADPQRWRYAPWLRELASSIDRPADQLLGDLLNALASSLTWGDGLLRTTAAHRASPVAIPWKLTDIGRWPALRD